MKIHDRFSLLQKAFYQDQRLCNGSFQQKLLKTKNPTIQKFAKKKLFNICNFSFFYPSNKIGIKVVNRQ